MYFDQLIAFSLYATVASITPGPNNTMVLASGLNYGFVRTIPHLAGIALGFTFMMVATGLGLHTVFVQFPMLQTILKYVGALYLLWLAWQLANAGAMSAEQTGGSSPMSFLGAAAFQWVNPKAWFMGVGALTTYLPQPFAVTDVLQMAAIFGLTCAPCVAIWTIFGLGLRRILQNPRSVRVINIGMALLLVASLYPIFSE